MKKNLASLVLVLLVVSVAWSTERFLSGGQASVTVLAGQSIKVDLYYDRPVRTMVWDSINDSAEVTGIASNLWITPGFDWIIFTSPGTVVNSGGG